jgi:hypothetical protein
MLKTIFPFDVKAEGKPGRFQGRASVYGVVDAVGDVVMPGAFTRHLREKGNRLKVLNQHNPEDVIGMATLTDTDTALLANGQLLLDLQSARDAYTRLKGGLIDGVSIGYSTPPGGTRYEDGHRLLVDLDLWEISLCTFPANDAARVTDVKRHGATLADVVASLRRLTASMREPIQGAGHKGGDPIVEELAALDREFEKLNAAYEMWGDHPFVRDLAAQVAGQLETAKDEKALRSSLAALTANLRAFNDRQKAK